MQYFLAYVMRAQLYQLPLMDYKYALTDCATGGCMPDW